MPEKIIGVTGHRSLPKLPQTRLYVRKVVSRLALQTERLVVLSPLAEGADRLVATEVLKLPNSSLRVVLPLEIEDYRKDFVSPASLAEFQDLLEQAEQVKVLPSVENREMAYEAVGRYVVDHCDLLVAIWDGYKTHKQGGTAEIVAYARNKQKLLCWIDSYYGNTGMVSIGGDMDDLRSSLVLKNMNITFETTNDKTGSSD